MPEGLRKLGALALRYNAQRDAYTFVLTDRYPYSGPALQPPAEEVDEEIELAPEPWRPAEAEA
jgi:hypothetical protein